MSQITSIFDVTTTGITAENYLPDAAKILSGKPEQNVWNGFSSRDEKFHVGTWDSQAGEWTISYSEDEFCLILEGESVISDKDGNQKTVKAGDQFVIPAGFEGTWSVPSYCKKIYVIYEA
ncbi:DUF861 domain-containing protein [Marinobacter salinisoli]|uniref:DUF861 domain-containing protein n=1 Tax=Marinobacter salinisoli TaxID=2769486 RepID=A0ABX7MXT4_9GAMM|nr:cupin domain-containing protein [Marinobacter salinisoli]QSP95013.1 DUF861 domain-containing protein [Marinobacter salinisoli]